MEYPPAVQSKAADEIEAMPPEAVLPGIMLDYDLLRRRCHALDKKDAAV